MLDKLWFRIPICWRHFRRHCWSAWFLPKTEYPQASAPVRHCVQCGWMQKRKPLRYGAVEIFGLSIQRRGADGR